ncbi:MAG TPA: succinate dehydrogenase cytochrome b subunit [Paludibacteraceae bacterium]|nr:succinate dehydrogenase cytochrome b subunit [Paludibacteraceae bacterium]
MWLIDSSIGRKVIMSVSGIFLILFLTFHSIMNVTVLFSGEAYNAVCEFLGANWYAVVGSMVLAAGFVVHIIYALYLSILNYKARGTNRYAVTKRQEGVKWASKNMLILGGVIFGFMALHLFQFWYKMQYAELSGVHTGDFHPADGTAFIIQLFSQPLYCVLYIVWLAALWFHLTHGVWSALQSIGLNNKTWLPRLKCFANIYSTFIILLFMAIPVLFLFGFRPM